MSCCDIIPRRYIVLLMMHLAAYNSFQLRVVPYVVVSELVERSNITILFDACPQYKYIPSKQNILLYFAWPEVMASFGATTFFIGYTVAHIPAAWLADKFGAKHVLGIGMLVSAIATMLLPIAIQTKSFNLAICLRLIFGLAQAPLFPSIASMIQHWIPRSERCFLGGVAFGGEGLGICSGYLLTGPIMKYTNMWAMPFYVWGSMAIIWYLFHLGMVFSRPSSHPYISQQELEFFNSEMIEKEDFKTPWKGVLTSIPVWVLFVLNFGDSYMSFTLMGYFPEYMKVVLKWDVESNATFNSMPYLFYWLMNIVLSWFANYMLDYEWCSLLAIRKVYAVIGNVVAAAFILMAVYMDCNRTGAVVMYVIALACKGAIINTIMLNANDLSEHYAGIVIGVTNGFSGPAGILGPRIAYYLHEGGTPEEWQGIFGAIFGICCATTAVYMFFAKAERQVWDYPPRVEH